MSSSDPEERELMPGVFVTDFRTAHSMSTADTANADAARQRSQQQSHMLSSEQQAKRKHEDEGDDDDEDESIAAASASASSSASLPSRPSNSALPADIPTDVESLELELATLETNLGQLVRSNAELQAELLLDPSEQIYIDAIAENRTAMMRRSERITAIRKQLQILAPHRVQARENPGAHEADPAAPNPPADAAADGAAAEPEGGLFL